jgi:cellobiose-specific phosphotransferase system component IIB
MKLEGKTMAKKKDSLLRNIILGLTAGAGTSALVTHIAKKKQFSDIDKEIEKATDPSLDDNTLTLVIPKEKIKNYTDKNKELSSKSASARDFVKHFPETSGVTVTRDHGNLSTLRNSKGLFTSEPFDDNCVKQAAKFIDDGVNNAAFILSGAVGATLGYKIINKILTDKHVKELNDRADKEQTEYLDKLMHDKEAEFASGLYKDAGMPKKLYDAAKNTVSLGILLTAAGTTSAAVLVKRILDKASDREDPEKALNQQISEEPEIKRVVIKSGSADTNPITVDLETYRAGIFCLTDTMRHIGEKTAEHIVESTLSPDGVKSLFTKLASDKNLVNDILSTSSLTKTASMLPIMLDVAANTSQLVEASDNTKDQSKKKSNKSKKSKKFKHRIKIEADTNDPATLAYIIRNRSKIQRTLDKLRYTEEI